MRCIVNYESGYDARKLLAGPGINIVYNNEGQTQLIAEVPKDQIERIRGLQGIVDINESPLPRK